MIDQWAIAITGVTAIWLSQSKDRNKARWACIVGMIAQPFWFYATVTAEQWGIVILCVLYTFAWMRGIYTFWIEPGFLGRDQNAR